MQFLASVNWTVVFAVLWGLCEALAFIPALKANSVFQLISQGAQFLYQKFGPQPPAPPSVPPAV